MAAYAFDLKSLYVLADWEGSASDLQVLDSTLTRQNKLQMLEDSHSASALPLALLAATCSIQPGAHSRLSLPPNMQPT
ncbi:hypothetical protein ACFX1X_020164 [Malus domestica]